MSAEAAYFASRVKVARLEAMMTQTEVATKIGKTTQWLSEVERGNIGLSYEMAVRIASACGKPVDFFCKRSPEIQDNPVAAGLTVQ